jgi:hypothetical protein
MVLHTWAAPSRARRTHGPDRGCRLDDADAAYPTPEIGLGFSDVIAMIIVA